MGVYTNVFLTNLFPVSSVLHHSPRVTITKTGVGDWDTWPFLKPQLGLRLKARSHCSDNDKDNDNNAKGMHSIG